MIKNAKKALKQNDFKKVTMSAVAAKKAVKEATKTKNVSDLIAEIHQVLS